MKKKKPMPFAMNPRPKTMADMMEDMKEPKPKKKKSKAKK